MQKLRFILRKMNGLVSTTFTLQQKSGFKLDIVLFPPTQVQHYGSCHKEWNGNYLQPRRPQAFIPPTVHGHTFSLPHGSPTHSAGHPQPPGLLSYLPSATVAHLLPSPCPPPAARPILQPAYSLVHHQGISVGINHRLLPSPTLLPQAQFKALFPPHSYMASPVYAGFPLSPSKLSHYPYIWAGALGSHVHAAGTEPPHLSFLMKFDNSDDANRAL